MKGIIYNLTKVENKIKIIEIIKPECSNTYYFRFYLILD